MTFDREGCVGTLEAASKLIFCQISAEKKRSHPYGVSQVSLHTGPTIMICTIAVHRQYESKAEAAIGSMLQVCWVGLAFFANISAALDLLVACGYSEGPALHQNTAVPMDKGTREIVISIVVLRSKRAAARLKATRGHRMVRILTKTRFCCNLRFSVSFRSSSVPACPLAIVIFAFAERVTCQY